MNACPDSCYRSSEVFRKTIPQPLNVVLAQCETQLVAFAPGHAQAARDHALAHQLHSLNAPAHDPGSVPVGPEFAEWAGNAVAVRVIDPLIPGARTLREL